MNHVSELALWIASIVFTAVLSILFEEPIHRALARSLSRWAPRQPRDLTGVWEAEYTYISNSRQLVEKQLVELRQVGGFVYGHTLRGQSHGHISRGRFQNELYFTGTWENTRPGSIYHGCFQFLLDPEGNKMEGKWLGFSDTYKEVNHGNWSWKLTSKRLEDAKSLATNWRP
jgi:hypothetical protein